MKKIVFVLLTLFNFLGHTQQIKHKGFMKNIVSFEGGMFHRGLIGASYNRFLVDRKHTFLTAGGGAGIGGIPFGRGVNQFYYVSTCFGIGFELDGLEFYLAPGLEFKYVNYYTSDLDAQNNYYSIHSEGIGLVPSLALTLIDDVLFAQMRVALFNMVDTHVLGSPPLGVGVTIGKIF
jgi:hypothetical protein